MSYLKYIIAFVVIAGFVYAGLAAMDAFTSEAFALLSAALIAVIFERFQWLHDEFDKLSPEGKQLAMFIFMVVLVYGAFGLSCAGKLAAWPCTGAGALDALTVLVFAIAANQSAFKLAHRAK
jgi:hypothetical protein